MGDLSEHFSRKEFACKCGCGLDKPVAPELVSLLEEIRSQVGPVKINSGLRCADRNREEGGKPSSAHLTGEAADISAPDGTRLFTVAKAGFLAGAKRIGIGKGFVHVDVSTSLPRPVLWTY